MRWIAVLIALTVSAGLNATTPEQEAPQNEIDTLRERLDQLEARLQSREESADTGIVDNDDDRGSLPEEPASVQAEPVPARMMDDGGSAVSGTERAADGSAESPEPAIHIGGALRFNAVHREFADDSRGKRGESGLDVFRLNIDGQLDNILISAEYRNYAYMQTLHHGWIGYEFEDQSQLQFGIHQVPFGLLPYAAHNAWFGVPYYTGLADNYDMGVKYQRSDGPWTSHLAFYKNEELNDASNLDRYAFDLVRVGEEQNEEINRINGRLVHTFGMGTGCEIEAGGSAQTAQVYNHETRRRGDHWAAAAHLDSRCGRWNLQLQATRYRYDPVNPEPVDNRTMRVGAFAGSYDIASRADIAVANIAYNLEPPWEQLDQMICYNDYSRMLKDLSGAQDSQMNTLGCALGAGPIFAYFDYIMARNMPYFGGSLATGGDDRWRGRFNVNIGYYW